MFTFREKSYKIWLWYLFGNIYWDKCIYIEKDITNKKLKGIYKWGKLCYYVNDNKT